MSAYAYMTDEQLASAEELCCEVANECECMRVKVLMAQRIRMMREECKMRTRLMHEAHAKAVSRG